jgi:hypothetical protein
MSDFPKGKGTEETRRWLDGKGFRNGFVGWQADALLGADRSYILRVVPEDEGERLWGLLRTARTSVQSNQGTSRLSRSISLILLHLSLWLHSHCFHDCFFL